MAICQLRNLKSVHPTYDERVNIEDIKTDMIPCINKRGEQFLAQIKKPYASRYGEVAVNVVFLPGEEIAKGSCHPIFE